MPRRRSSYHHGSLRTAAIEAAIREMDRSGHEAFTLDGLARSLGVTPPALYRHFQNREDLLRAVILEGFERFVQRMDAAATTPAEPLEVLRETGRVYVRFAVENPGWFRLQFSRAGVETGGRYENVEPRYFQAMMDAVARVTGAEGEEVQRAYLLLWSTAHGLASLTVEKVFGFVPDEQRLALADGVLDTLLEQLVARGEVRRR